VSSTSLAASMLDRRPFQSWTDKVGPFSYGGEHYFPASVFDTHTTRQCRDWCFVEKTASISASGTTREIARQIPFLDGTIELFFQKYPFLEELVLEVRDRLLDYLPGSTFTLEHFIDPEEGDQYLVLYAKSAFSPEVASEKIDEFLVEWWCDRMDQARGKLAINLRFADEF